MHRLRRDAAAKARRLLRVLLVRLGALPAGAGGARGQSGCRFLLRMSSDPVAYETMAAAWLPLNAAENIFRRPSRSIGLPATSIARASLAVAACSTANPSWSR